MKPTKVVATFVGPGIAPANFDEALEGVADRCDARSNSANEDTYERELIGLYIDPYATDLHVRGDQILVSFLAGVAP